MNQSRKNRRTTSQDALTPFCQHVFILKQETQNVNYNNLTNHSTTFQKPHQLFNQNSDSTNRNNSVSLSRNRSTFHETRRPTILFNLVSPPVNISSAISENLNQDCNSHRRTSIDSFSTKLFPMLIPREVHISQSSNHSLSYGLIKNKIDSNCNNKNNQQQQQFIPGTLSQNRISQKSSTIPAPIFYQPILKQNVIAPVAMIDLRCQNISRNRSLTNNSNNQCFLSRFPNSQASLVQDNSSIRKVTLNDNDNNFNYKIWKQEQSLESSLHKIKSPCQKYLPVLEEIQKAKDFISIPSAQRITQNEQTIIDYPLIDRNKNICLFSQATELIWSEKCLIWEDSKIHKKSKSTCILPTSNYYFQYEAKQIDQDIDKNVKLNQIEGRNYLRNYEETQSIQHINKNTNEQKWKSSRNVSQEQNMVMIKNIQVQLGKSNYNLKLQIQNMIQTEINGSCRFSNNLTTIETSERQFQGGYNESLGKKGFGQLNYQDNNNLYCTFSQQEEKKQIPNRKFIFRNGFWYSGQWENNNPNGLGMVVDNLGQIIYEGGFLNGMLTGNGIFYNQNVYEITQANPRNLFETQIYQIRQEGQFKDGQLSGFGLITFSSGEKFIGEFQEDLPHGQGVLYSKQTIKGEWNKGVFIQSNLYK